MVFSKERPVILNRLCNKCANERSLPKSMIMTDASLQTDFKRPVGRGGFANVYRGEYDGRPAAVKVMRFHLSTDIDDLLSVCTTFHAVHKNQL